MKPSTPSEALACALHTQLHPDCQPPFCCAFWSHDEVDGQDLERALAEIGWHLAPSVSLPESVPAGDPRYAASELNRLNERQWAVWSIVAVHGDHGLTSTELNDEYARQGGLYPDLPPMKHDSPRKRLPELERAGHIRKTDRLRDGAHVWVAADASAVAA